MCPKFTFIFFGEKKKVNLLTQWNGHLCLVLVPKETNRGEGFCPLYQNEYPQKSVKFLFSAHMCLVCSWLLVPTKVMEAY